MKNLYQPERVEEVKQRLDQLQSGSQRQWGKMNAPQAVAHCAVAIELALGDSASPRLFFGRIAGVFIKPLVFRDDEPMRRNAPSTKNLIIQDERDFDLERARLRKLIDRFAAAGPSGCTAHPHGFFGPLKPEEWSILMYKHLDHHLRQFGV
jgi:hypothetical protein